VILPLLALAFGAHAAVPAAPQPAQIGASRTALATVFDGKNQALVDLGPDDFVVREAGQPREILGVRPADYPVVVLFDNSGEARRDFEQIRKAVTRFVGRLGGRPIAVGTTADPPAMLTTFDDDRKVLGERIASLMPTPTTTVSMPLQATADAARLVQDTGALFSAIVVVAAAPGDGSRNPPQELLTAILSSGAMVHGVQNRLMPNATGRTVAEILQGLTEQTRGQFAAVYSSASYQVALDHLADRLNSELMIDYVVPARSDASDVRIGVRIPGARVRGLGVAPR